MVLRLDHFGPRYITLAGVNQPMTQALSPGPPAGPPGAGERNARRGGRALKVLGGLVLAFLLCLSLISVGVDNGPLALATGLVLAVLPAPFYVSLALRMDRFEPEPVRLLAWTFFWGAAGATFIALVLNTVGQAIVGDQFGAHVGELYGGSVSAPIVEEVAKGAVLYVLYRRFRAHFNSVVDGVVYAAMVGLGFATTENILYYASAAEEGGVPLAATFFMRGVMSPFTHPIFTAMTGIGLAVAVGASRRWRRRLAPALGLLAAILLHSAWNTSASVGEGAGFILVFGLVLVVAIALLGSVGAGQRREGRIVAARLVPEMSAGILTREELFTLSSGRERMRARRAAKKAGGRRAGRSMKRLQMAASQLAFTRHRRESGLPADAGASEEDQLARLREAIASVPAGTLAPPIPRGSRRLPPPPAPMRPDWTPTPGAAVTGPPAPARSTAPGPATAPGPSTAPGPRQLWAGADPPAVPPPPAPLPPAAWYPDPWGQAALRWWDGRAWTWHVHSHP